jgi:hypothetical protein
MVTTATNELIVVETLVVAPESVFCAAILAANH